MWRTWIVLPWLSACDPSAESSCEAAAAIDDPSLEISNSEESFEQPLQDGDLLQPVRGPQGGQHVYIAVRTHGFAPGRRQMLGDEEIPVFDLALIGIETRALFGEQQFAWEAMQGDEESAQLALGELYLSGYDEEETTEDVQLSARAIDICGNELKTELTLGFPR